MIDHKGVAELGEIKFWVQYLPDRKCLRVYVIKCDNLPPRFKDQQLNPFVKVRLACCLFVYILFSQHCVHYAWALTLYKCIKCKSEV